MGYTPLDQLQDLHKATIEAQTELYQCSSSKMESLADTVYMQIKTNHVHIAGNT